MKLRIKSLVVLMAMLIILAGCASSKKPVEKPKPITIQAKLYYATEGNERLEYETRTIQYQKGQNKYRVVLQELLKGPVSLELVRNIPSQTRVLSTTQKGQDLIVNLSRDFRSFPGEMAEIMAVGSIVNTMIALDNNVNRVRLQVEGQDYIGPSGKPRGYMTWFTNPPEARQYILYFSNEQADKVIPEKRTLIINPEASKEEIARTLLNELIKGPRETGHFKTIPREAQIKSVRIVNNTVYADFSQEMHTKHWHGAAGEAMTINSIVSTLTEIPGIQKVGISVEGKPLNIEHVILKEPIERNPSMIGKSL